MSATEHLGKRGPAAKNRSCSLELVSTRGVFRAGGLLTGVVVLRALRPVRSCTLKVWVQGVELPVGKPPRGISRAESVFFVREKLIAGVEPPHKARERLSLLWNAFLGRTDGRRVLPAEHIYPFGISLPASLPPSYSGSAGRIEYTLGARLSCGLGRSIAVEQLVGVGSNADSKGAKPAIIRYPTAGAEHKAVPLIAELTVHDTVLEVGSAIKGHFKLSSCGGHQVKGASVCLELCERARSSQGGAVRRKTADELVIEDLGLCSDVVEADFTLCLPSDGPPTVQAASISVSWSVRLRVDSDPPVDLRCPIVVLGFGLGSTGQAQNADAE